MTLLACLAASTLSLASVEPKDVIFRASGTYLNVKVALDGFETDVKGFEALHRRYRDFAVAYGHVVPKDVTFSILSSLDETGDGTSVEWRKRTLANTLTGAGVFELQGIACSEHIREIGDPFVQTSWHAFALAGDRMFDLHVNFIAEKDKPLLPRAEFERIVTGARFAIVRRGTWAEYGAPTLALMHEHLAQGPSGLAALREKAKAADAAPSVHFALAELARARTTGASKPEALLELHHAAANAYSALAEPSASDTFERAVALDGEGLALLDLDRAKDALAPLASARELLASTQSTARGPITYDLACAQARAGEAKTALATLTEAVALDERFRSQAAADKDFATLKSDAAFVELVRATKRQ